jgi:small subunit ribosomal protein S20
VKTQIKHLETVIDEGNVAAAQDQFKLVAQRLDKVASTSTMHKKTAARKKSRLAKKVNALKAKQKA